MTEQDNEAARRLLRVLRDLESGLIPRRGTVLEWSPEELRDGELNEAISLSFERLHHFVRGYLGIDPNG